MVLLLRIGWLYGRRKLDEHKVIGIRLTIFFLNIGIYNNLNRISINIWNCSLENVPAGI